ncbi:MAG: hypothetical protein U9Q22_04905 [Candidatus Altiarchaeota archaeon]|nr:hypothetical protein [Candidatus Altiarchaeota archaeon]
MDRKEICDKIAELLKNHGAKKIAVFGSFVRGEDSQRGRVYLSLLE